MKGVKRVEKGEIGGRECVCERVDKGSTIATINTSSARLLARLVLALYYVFNAA